MDDERKIEGVPEGWRVVAIRAAFRKGEWIVGSDGQAFQMQYDWQGATAVIERIPEPAQKRVLQAEWDLSDREYLTDMGKAFFLSADGGQGRLSSPDRIRILVPDA